MVSDSISRFGEHFALFLGEQNNIQYWFARVDYISEDIKNYISGCIVGETAEAYESSPGTMQYKIVIRRRENMPILVIMYYIDTEPAEVELSISDKSGDLPAIMVETMNMALRYLCEGTPPTKTVVLTKEKIRILESPIDESLSDAFKKALKHISIRSGPEHHFKLTYAPYLPDPPAS